MKDSLLAIFSQMSEALSQLQSVMDEEREQLSAGNINSSALQRITDQKSSLLATLDYLEQQRRALNATASPQALQQWQDIRGTTARLRDHNQHNGWLLEEQILRNQQALELLKPLQEPQLYGANGQTRIHTPGSTKKISI